MLRLTAGSAVEFPAMEKAEEAVVKGALEEAVEVLVAGPAQSWSLS